MARVEAKAREEAHQKFEQEKKSITKKMETEIMELQTHLRLFKKVCCESLGLSFSKPYFGQPSRYDEKKALLLN